jgi:hypothetical protein
MWHLGLASAAAAQCLAFGAVKVCRDDDCLDSATPTGFSQASAEQGASDRPLGGRATTKSSIRQVGPPGS